MGRLNKRLNDISVDNTTSLDESTGTTINNHIFIDDNGNVTQINKIEKDRIKYYVEKDFDDTIVEKFCVIGISDPSEGDCSSGIGLGLGDTTYGYAKYETDL